MKSSELEAFERLQRMGAIPGEELFSPDKSGKGYYTKLLKEESAKVELPDNIDAKGSRSLSFEDCWHALEKHVADVAALEWPCMKGIAAIASRASELGLRLTQRNCEQLLEAAQRKARPAAEPVGPGESFAVAETPWAVDQICRNGLNLLVGQAGAGKSRFSAALIAAWLRGDRTWLNHSLPCSLPVEQRHALIVGTDQPLEDWALTLEPVGLAERLEGGLVRIHPRLTLHPLETGTALDSDGLAIIRRWVDAHPGGVVLIDSLAACLPPGIDEDKPAAARPIHALQDAIAGGWGILTHHARKGAGRDGNRGVGAGRGSSAIDGAVSRVLVLSLIHRVENGTLVPLESDPRRELLSTKRGGQTVHLVVRSDATGHWSNEGSAAELKQQERRERARDGLSEAQDAVCSLLEEARTELTTRQVVEGLHGDGSYDPRGPAAATIRKQLTALQRLGLASQRRVGVDALWRATAPTPNTVSPVSSLELYSNGSHGSQAAAQGISPAHTSAHMGSQGDCEPCEPSPEHCEPCEPCEPACEPPCEPVKPTAPQLVSHVSRPPLLTPVESRQVGLPIAVSPATDDPGDDPHWPPREAC